MRAGATLIAAVVAAGMLVLSAQAGFGMAMGWPWFAGLGDGGMESVFTLVLFGLLVSVAMAGLRVERRRLTLGSGVMTGVGLAVGIGGLTVAMLLAMIAGLVQPGQTAATHGLGLLLIGTLTVVIQSAAEEVYFRGWLQPVLIRGWGAAAGVIVAALAFSALHVAGGARSPMTLLNIFLAGSLFGMIALRTGGILAAAAAHAGWNWAEAMLFGLDPNPGVGSFGTIADLDLVGSAWWGGSAEGLNASIGVTLVLIALILPLIAWRTKRMPAVSSPPASG